MASEDNIYDKDGAEKQQPYLSSRPGYHPPGPAGDPKDDTSNKDTRSDLNDQEKSFFNPNGDAQGEGGLDDVRDAESSGEQSFFNEDSDKGRRTLFGRRGGGGGRNLSLNSLIKNRKNIMGLLAVITTTTGIISVLLLSIGSLNLSNFMANVEKKGFTRFQVDMNGRSSKWINAYLTLRFAEVDNPSLAPKDRDNLIFRSDRVDRNNPAFDWYRTMRASKFEDELFEKRGIKFTSYAYQSGNSIRFRPAVMSINDKPIDFDINGSEIDALQRGDINGFNNRLIDYVDIQKFGNDREARAAINEILRDEYPKWYHAYKRYHLRTDIANMIGVRRWTFFENKRQAAKENLQDRRNAVVKKFVSQTLPEDSKSGKFIECLFGLSECSSSRDPANPNARKYTPVAQREGDQARLDTNGDGKADAVEGDGSGTNNLNTGSSDAAKAGESLRGALPKLFKNFNIASIIDSLSRFDKALHDRSLSKFVVQAKSQYVVGVFTTLKIADDQLKTGEVKSEEVSAFMEQYGNLSNNEGWSTVVSGSSGATASAASKTFTNAKNKEEFCSNEHQAEIEKPMNKQWAEMEYQFMCPGDKVGGDNAAADLEDGWNKGPGRVLSPILGVWRGTIGHIFGFLDSIIGAITTPIMDATGISGTMEDIIGFVGARAIKFAGANMDINSSTPSGRVGILGLEGSTALAEATTRQSGAARTTTESRRDMSQRVFAYEQAERQNASYYQRYFALSNPESLVSSNIPRFASMSQSLRHGLNGSMFASLFKAPLQIFSMPVGAEQEDGYAAARFAGIDTYDLPQQCLDSIPLTGTPQGATNADELGYIPANELTWDLMSDKVQWYDKLYQAVGGDEDKAMKVWNCELLDNVLRGSIGAKYGYKGKNAFEPTKASSSTDSSGGSTPTGSAKDLAKQLLESGKVKGDPRYMSQIEATARGDYSCNVNPTILKMLVGVAVQDSNTIYITSLNRKCTGVLTASGTGSYHYRSGGGHAVDVGQFNGSPVGSGNAASTKYLEAASKYLPRNTGYGQIKSCGIDFKVPSGSYSFEDTCDHIHIQVPEQQAK